MRDREGTRPDAWWRRLVAWLTALPWRVWRGRSARSWAEDPWEAGFVVIVLATCAVIYLLLS